MRLALSVKDHEPYSQNSLKVPSKEHRNFRHYLVPLSIFQTLVMNLMNPSNELWMLTFFQNSP